MANVKNINKEREVRDISGISDAIFKEVFKDPEILVDYINTICNIHLDYKDIEYMPLESKNSFYARGVRYDVRCVGKTDDEYFHINFEGQRRQESKRIHDNRKIYYASQLFIDSFKEGDIFDKNVYIREIFFIKESNSSYSGSPIKKIILEDTYDKVGYPHVEIYEIYIEELIKHKNELRELGEYGRIISELTEVLISKDVEKYTSSNNQIAQKVAKKIMAYTEEEKRRLQEQFDRDNERELREFVKAHTDKAREEALAEGERETIERNAKALYQNGVSKEIIATSLGITLEELETILKK